MLLDLTVSIRINLECRLVVRWVINRSILLRGVGMCNFLKFGLFACLLTLYATLASASPGIVNNVHFLNYQGKWVVISYWASWCGYCMEEIPELNAFYRAHGNQVVMFGVNYNDPGNLAQHIRQSKVMFPTLASDPKREFGVRYIDGLPTTLLIGPNGRLKGVLEGPQTKASLEKAMGL